MSKSSYPRNQPCPCGSEKKYKACCYRRGIQFAVEDDQVVRVVPLRPEVTGLLNEARDAFVKKFGREPGPHDPIIFDPDAETPQPIPAEKFERDIVEALEQAGVRDEIIYAYEKTGMLLTEYNRHGFPEKDVREFEDAVDEFRELLGES